MIGRPGSQQPLGRKEDRFHIRAHEVSGHPWFPANVRSFELLARKRRKREPTLG